ncbi:MAG: hypothetical protein HDQ97_00155 [Lachnospiraceae bacterium]|nr:hypothetical protein [Lachnospiraceae bacterium]
MVAKINDNIKEIIQTLMQLDEKNLLLIDSGSKLLLSRQNMDKEAAGSNKQLVEV